MLKLPIDDSFYMNCELPEGYNLYVYYNNNPAMYKQRPALGDSYSLSASSISAGIPLNNIILANEHSQNMLCSSAGFNFFDAELRSSLGWNNSPTIATGCFGRFIISSHNTMTKGQSDMLYTYAGSTKDSANLLETN
jgi:hypothetical protein